MSLPDSRDLTLGANSQWPSATANSLQDELIAARKMLHGSHFHLSEDFTGDNFSYMVGNWMSTAINAPNSAIVPDNTNGAYGALQMPTNSGATQTFTTDLMNFVTNDFRVSSVARTVQVGTTACEATIGLRSATAAQEVYFISTLGGNWKAKVGAAAAVDLTTPTALSTTYKHYEIRKIGSTVKFYINGVELYSTAFTTTQAAVHLQAQSKGTSGSHHTDLYLDSIKLWVAR